MLRPKLVKNGASGAGHISGVVVVAAYLILGWSRPAFSVEPTAAPDDQSHLQLAPIILSHFVGGNIGYLFQRTSGGANDKFIQQSLGVGVTGGVGIRSYFWQPWIAEVSSNLVAGVNKTSTNSSMTPTQSSVSTAISGEAALDLLKPTRFPFQARIFRQDNKYDSFYSGSSVTSQTTGYGLSQIYKSRDSRLTGNADFMSSKFSGSNLSPNYMDIFNLSLMVVPARYQSISILGNLTSTNQPAQGRSLLLDTLVVNHLYQPGSIFSVASVVNLLKTNSSMAQGTGPTQQFDANSLQFNSYMSLRPEKSPLTVTGGVRFLRSDTSSNGILTPTLTSSNFNLGANYIFSRYVRMYGSVNVFDGLGIQTVSTSAALAAAKPLVTSTTTNVGDFRYTASIGGNLSSNSTASTNSANQINTQNNPGLGSANRTTTQNNLGLGLYLSHALDRDREFGAGHLSENLHQTISKGVSVSSGINGTSSSIPRLNSGGALTWIQAEGKGTTLLRLSASDSRNLGGTTYIFQMINLQASRSKAMSNHESLRGNLTVQATHQEYGIQNTPNTITPSAEASYNNNRAFKVKHLTFESILRIADTNIAPLPLSAQQDQATRTWDNNFAYKVGRLSTLLNTRIAKYGNVVYSSILFSVSRSF